MDPIVKHLTIIMRIISLYCDIKNIYVQFSLEFTYSNG